jgi:hypothetical protein
MSFSISSFLPLKTNKHNESIFNSIGSSLGKSGQIETISNKNQRNSNDVDLIVLQMFTSGFTMNPAAVVRNDAGQKRLLGKL